MLHNSVQTNTQLILNFGFCALTVEKLNRYTLSMVELWNIANKQL